MRSKRVERSLDETCGFDVERGELVASSVSHDDGTGRDARGGGATGRDARGGGATGRGSRGGDLRASVRDYDAQVRVTCEQGYEDPTTIQRGASAETIAVRFLERRGYRIVERNFKTKLGELDIVARDGSVLCFIEVRSRSDDHFGNAAESVNHVKRGKVTKMARIYLGQRRPAFDEARFDVVALTGDRIDLIRDAWRLGDRT
jgi:putative endonuclease